MRFWFTILLINVSAIAWAGGLWLLVATMTDGPLKAHEAALMLALLLLLGVNVAAAHWLSPCAEREQKAKPQKCAHVYFATSADVWKDAFHATHTTEITRICVLCWQHSVTRWSGAWNLNALNYGYDTPEGLRDAYLTKLAREKASSATQTGGFNGH